MRVVREVRFQVSIVLGVSGKEYGARGGPEQHQGDEAAFAGGRGVGAVAHAGARGIKRGERRPEELWVIQAPGTPAETPTPVLLRLIRNGATLKDLG